MKTFIILLLLLSNGNYTFGQSHLTTQDSLIQQVFRKNVPHQNFHFKMKDKAKTEYFVRYLGNIKVNNSKVYKIINFQTLSVPVGRTTHYHAIILLYDIRNKYQGCYHVFDEISLPDYIDNQQLVIVGKLHCKETTKISFAKAVPDQIYIRCNENGGNLYSFTADYPFWRIQVR